MTSINGEKFDILPKDNTETILERYAYYKNTLPKYLFFEKEFKIGEDNTVENILDILKQYNDTYKNFYEKYKYIYPDKDIEKQKSYISIQEILELWIMYSKSVTIPEEYKDQIYQLFIQEIYSIHDIDINIEEILEKSKNTKLEIAEKIENFRKQFESKKSLDSVTPVPFTDIDIQYLSISCKLNIPELTLSEVFNDIILNNDIPFVYFKNFFKILKKFKVDEAWYEETQKDELVLYVKDKISEESFIKVIIDENFNINFELNTKKGYVSKEEFIDKIIKVLNNNRITVGEIVEEKISGIYDYNNMIMNSYIFADLVLNDELFSKYISIDESIKATKKTTSSGEQWIYIHYNDEIKDNHVTAGITQKIPDNFHEESYLRINCKGKHIYKVKIFQNILGKFLTLYNEKKDAIIKEYKKYIPEFTVEEKYERKSSKKEKKDEFINPRKCQSHKNLKKISKEDYDNYRSRDMDAIEFPRSISIGTKYPSDGENVQYFICEKSEEKLSKYIYTGLQDNRKNEENGKKYPFTPCCFTTSQVNKPIYREYYMGEEIKDKETKQQNIISTNKFVKYLNFGELPEMLNKIFENFDPLTQYTYYRLGFDRNKNSFLACVLTAIIDNQYTMDKEYAIKFNKEKNDQVRSTLLSNLRKNFVKNNSLYPVSKQCAYDISDHDLVNDILNNESYFDPKKYIQMIEEYYGINIILFNREGIIKPYYSEKYYYNFNDKNFVFIYEHMGSESDNALYPQCELIVTSGKNTINQTFYIFDQDSIIVQNIKRIFSDITKSYGIFLENIFTKKYFEDNEINLISQIIDSYGKTREINVKFNNTDITIYTTPLQPLRIPINKENLKYPTTREIATTILKKLNMEIVSDMNDRVSGKYKNNTFTILTEEEKTSSSLTVYNNNKKIARYISEYTLWHFSNYIEEEKIENVTMETLKNFTEQGFIIIENYNYKNINRIFSKNSSVFKDGKLIVTSTEMRNRLLYLLRLKLQQQYSKIISYNNIKIIPNFYIDLTDFDVHQNQIVLQGEDCLYKWNNSLDGKTYLYKEVIPEIKTPYFFTNPIINDNIYIAQNTDNIETALKICLNWEKHGYNIGYYGESDNLVLDYSYTLYSYGNENDIDKYYIKSSINTNMEIIGYKIEEKSFFTSLLKI